MNDEALDWDSPIENEGSSFAVLPEDTECTYVVLSMEKARSESSNCPQAIIELELTAIDGNGTARVKDFLTLNRKSEWKLCEFFISNGQRQHGERIAPNWAKVPGCTGRCTVAVKAWRRRGDPEDKAQWTGQENRIKKYLEPAADAGEVSFG